MFFARFYKMFTNACLKERVPTILSGIFCRFEPNFFEFAQIFCPLLFLVRFFALLQNKFLYFFKFYGDPPPLLFLVRLFAVLIGVFCQLLQNIHKHVSPPTIHCWLFCRFEPKFFEFLQKFCPLLYFLDLFALAQNKILCFLAKRKRRRRAHTWACPLLK